MAHSGRSAPLAAAALAIAVAAIAAACGGASPASFAPPPSGVVAVEAREYRFTPSTLSVAAGKVTFFVRNAGTVEHEFEIFKGDQVVDELEGLVPGLGKNLTLELAAGQYTFVCKLSGHDQLGMNGTLTVN